MKVDIKNIDKNKNTIWGLIYEVIDAPFLEKRIFSHKLFRLMFKYLNQPQFLPSDVKIVLKRMATEQWLYEQVVMIRQKDLDNKKEKENTNNITSKGSPQYQYFGSILIVSSYKKSFYTRTGLKKLYQKIWKVKR